ncbi:TetR/AcrR family transcriptional regulator [Rubrivivax sp. RP6-9]|uniref:TetR/AcrR family transcriptional regulator n=1 Tax=Rubrivivax sp. RP6-9 TaxID=3415750 RepID=UPI003CC6218C
MMHPTTDTGVSTHDAGPDTRRRILEAAFQRLAARGYASLNVRDIARDAGVNHALISYYFGGKDRLVIAVLDEANRQLLQRQQQLYGAPGGFADKWARARRFYESDLASGFVRVQAELWAASLANAELRAQFLPRIQAWKQLVLDGVREAMLAYQVDLPPAFSAEAIATLLSEFWLGMEFSQLIGARGETARHDATLDAIEALLRTLDARVAAPAPKPARRARPARSKP